ncbi:MAG: hypothetical protein WD009_06930 [Phycisphaeraceae bacterium]
MVVVLAWAAAATAADRVDHVAGSTRGAVRFSEDHVDVGDRSIAWGEVVTLWLDRPHRIVRVGEGVELTHGEWWRGRVTDVSGSRVTFEHPLLGTHEIDRGAVAAIAFDGVTRPGAAGRLNRIGGDAVPGELMWADGEAVTLDSPLGVVDVPRDVARGYRLRDAQLPARGASYDELILVDGSRLHGRVTPMAEGLRVEHAQLGEVELPGAAVRGVVRRDAARVAHLADLEPAAYEAEPLISRRPELERVALTDGEPGPGIYVVRIRPTTRVRYELPAAHAFDRLRGRIAPVAGARGSVRVTLSDDAGQTIETWTIEPGDEAGGVDVRHDNLATLNITVEFAGEVRLPAGVELGDWHLVRSPTGEGE